MRVLKFLAEYKATTRGWHSCGPIFGDSGDPQSPESGEWADLAGTTGTFLPKHGRACSLKLSRVTYPSSAGLPHLQAHTTTLSQPHQPDPLQSFLGAGASCRLLLLSLPFLFSILLFVLVRFLLFNAPLISFKQRSCAKHCGTHNGK